MKFKRHTQMSARDIVKTNEPINTGYQSFNSLFLLLLLRQESMYLIL